LVDIIKFHIKKGINFEIESKVLALYVCGLYSNKTKQDDGFEMKAALNKLEQVFYDIYIHSGETHIGALTSASKLLEEFEFLTKMKNHFKTNELRFSFQCEFSFLNKQDYVENEWKESDKTFIDPYKASEVTCNTFVGKLSAFLLLHKYIEEMSFHKPLSISSTGINMISASLNVLTKKMHLPKSNLPEPADFNFILLFIVGGFTMEEVQEVRLVQEVAGKNAPTIILSGTTIATPEFISDQIFNSTHH